MAVKKPQNGDRVVCEGRKGTLVSIHESKYGAPPPWSVLFDDGPKEATTAAQGRRLGARRRVCDRDGCGGDHHPFVCPLP